MTAVLFGLSLYFKEANFIARAQLHTDVASKLWGVREALLSLLVDLASGRDVENIRRERNALNDKLTEIYQGAPRTDAKAYSEAQHALKDSEELFFTDAELDKMLPKQLRRSDIPERVAGSRV